MCVGGVHGSGPDGGAVAVQAATWMMGQARDPGVNVCDQDTKQAEDLREALIQAGPSCLRPVGGHFLIYMLEEGLNINHFLF